MLNTDEVGGVPLLAEFGDDQVEITSDEEGYFSAELANTGKTGWLNVSVTAIEDETVAADCPTFVPDPNAQFATISDIDDTAIGVNGVRIIVACSVASSWIKELCKVQTGVKICMRGWLPPFYDPSITVEQI